MERAVTPEVKRVIRALREVAKSAEGGLGRTLDRAGYSRTYLNKMERDGNLGLTAILEILAECGIEAWQFFAVVFPTPDDQRDSADIWERLDALGLARNVELPPEVAELLREGDD